MKLAGFLMMTFLVQVALPGESQKLSFSGKDVPLNHIFRIIKSQTGVLFFYDAALLQNAKPVTVKWESVTLETALNEIFKGQPFTWLLEGKTVTIIKKPRVTEVKTSGQITAVAEVVVQDPLSGLLKKLLLKAQ